MRVLFINPKSSNNDALPLPPLGLLSLTSYTRQRGYRNIKVIDNNRENRPLDFLIGEIQKTDIVALTGTTSQFKQGGNIASLAKKYHKTVVFGGPHVSFLGERCLQDNDIDIAVIGEGEVTFYEILEAIRKGKNFSNIKGIIFKEGKKIVKNNERPLVADLDELPFPSRDLVPITKYSTKELKRFSGYYTHIMSSRGCSGKCIFCSSPKMWKYVRLRSAQNVFKEMMELHDIYKIRNIHFQDDAFTISKKRVEVLCELISKSQVGFKWSCQARPDSVDYPLLKRMKNAGCVQIEFGVESGESSIIKRAQKGYTKFEISKACNDAKKTGLLIHGFFIVGLPGETLLSWAKSIIYARSLKLDSYVWTILVPFPGTKIFEEKMVEIVKLDYLEWRYKNPVIRSGMLGPRSLKTMRKIADIMCNGPFNTGAYKK